MNSIGKHRTSLLVIDFPTVYCSPTIGSPPLVELPHTEELPHTDELPQTDDDARTFISELPQTLELPQTDDVAELLTVVSAGTEVMIVLEGPTAELPQTFCDE